MLQLRYFFICLFSFSFFNQLVAQNDWSVSVIDSFKTSSVGQGIYGLNSITHNNTIHLTYFYHNQNSETYLLYAEKVGSSFRVDTVSTITDFNSYGVSTSLQFNSDGTKWIYAGFYSYPNHIIGVFKETNSGWDYTYLDETGGDKTIAVIQNNTEMGFAYSGKGENIHTQSIKYAQWNNSQWEITTVSKRHDTYKTKPSIIEAGGKIYLIFGEGRYPDSLITKVYVKENQTWQESFTELIETPYAGGSIAGLQNLAGVSYQGNPCILHTFTDEVHPSFYELNNQNWMRRSINFPSSEVITKWLGGSNILFDSQNTMFTISQYNGFGSVISWVKENGDASFADIPYKYIVWLQDFSILNNEIYVYYYDGYREFPYDRPATFKEAKISIDVLLTNIINDEEHLPYEFKLLQNYPNPFNPTTKINYSIPTSSKVSLIVYDILGREVKLLVNEFQNAGRYSIDFNAEGLSSGVYFYRLTSGQFSETRKLILLR